MTESSISSKTWPPPLSEQKVEWQCCPGLLGERTEESFEGCGVSDRRDESMGPAAQQHEYANTAKIHIGQDGNKLCSKCSCYHLNAAKN